MSSYDTDLKRTGPGAAHDRMAFLQEFLRHPSQVASIIPSSRFLERRLVRLAELSRARVVVELGAGTGGTTRALLETLPREARLLSIEINVRLCGLLADIPDARLTAHCGGAQDLPAILTGHGMRAPDVIVSGIPFSTLGADLGRRILSQAWSALAPGGRFIAYQLSSEVRQLAGPIFGPAAVETEWLNVPPLRLFKWCKPEAIAAGGALSKAL